MGHMSSDVPFNSLAVGIGIPTLVHLLCRLIFLADYPSMRLRVSPSVATRQANIQLYRE